MQQDNDIWQYEVALPKKVLCQLQRQLALRLWNKSVISQWWQKIAHTPQDILKDVWCVSRDNRPLWGSKNWQFLALQTFVKLVPKEPESWQPFRAKTPWLTWLICLRALSLWQLMYIRILNPEEVYFLMTRVVSACLSGSYVLRVPGGVNHIDRR